MTRKPLYITPFLWFVGALASAKFAFVLALRAVSGLAGLTSSALPSVPIALTSAFVSATVIGIASGMAAERFRAPEWAVIPAAMGVLWSRGPDVLASALDLQPGALWAWTSIAVALVSFAVATELTRWFVKRRSTSGPVPLAFSIPALLRRKGLMVGLGVALAFSGFSVWFTPSNFAGIPPLPSGRHDAVYFDSYPIELANGRLNTTVADDGALFGRYVRHSIRSDAATTFLFDGRKVSAQEFLRLCDENGQVETLVAGRDGLLLRVEGSSFDF